MSLVSRGEHSFIATDYQIARSVAHSIDRLKNSQSGSWWQFLALLTGEIALGAAVLLMWLKDYLLSFFPGFSGLLMNRRPSSVPFNATATAHDDHHQEQIALAPIRPATLPLPPPAHESEYPGVKIEEISPDDDDRHPKIIQRPDKFLVTLKKHNEQQEAKK